MSKKDPRTKCSNCNKTYRQSYSNKGFDCTGIVNETFRNCDVIRSCRRYDTGKTQLEDLSPEEALSIATGLLAAVHSWMKFTHKRPCANCPDKECGHAFKYKHIDAEGREVFCGIKEITEVEEGHCIGCECECDSAS